MTRFITGRRTMWAFIAAILFLLYLPLLPPLLFSVGAESGHLTLRWYAEMWRNPLLVGSIKTSILVALLTGLVTPPLALLGVIWASVIGLVGGLFPAVRAVRLPIATALRAA